MRFGFAALAVGVLALSGAANAATFSVTLYDHNAGFQVPNFSNVNDMTVVGKGTLFVRDSLIAPGAFISWSDANDVRLMLDFDDGFRSFSVDSGVGLITEPSTTRTVHDRDGSDYGIELDAEGSPFQFDSPDFSVSSPGAVVSTSTESLFFGGGYVDFLLNDDLNLGFAEEAGTGPNQRIIDVGDLVNTTTFGAAYAPIANFFRVGEGTSLFASGWAVFGDAEPNPIPVPAAAPLFVAALAGAGFMRRRLTAKV